MPRKYSEALKLFNEQVKRRYSVDTRKLLVDTKANLQYFRVEKDEAVKREKELLTEYKQTKEVLFVIKQNKAYIEKIDAQITKYSVIKDRLVEISNEANTLAEKMKRMYFRERNVAAEIMLGFYLHYELGIKSGTFDTDRKVFETPYGKRRLDAYYKPLSVALESKLGYVCLSKRVRSEIQKDKYLLSNGIISRCIWVLYSGGSKPLIRELEDSNIEISIGWSGHEMERIEGLGYLPAEYFA